MQIARHVNDEETLQEFFQSRRSDGIEIDVKQVGDWLVGTRGNGDGTLLDDFLHQVDAHYESNHLRTPLKTMIEIRGDRLDHSEADRLIDQCEAYRRDLEVRFLSYSPEIINTMFHATSSRDEPFACQIYMQEDDVTGHVQWSKRRRLGLPEEIGYHLRLHAFPPSKRPTYEEALETNRRISTTGWNPLYKGWRNADLSEVWNVKRR